MEAQLESLTALNARSEGTVLEAEEKGRTLEARMHDVEVVLAERESDYKVAVEVQESMLDELETKTGECERVQAELSAVDKERTAQIDRAYEAEQRVATLETSDGQPRDQLDETSAELATTHAQLTEATEGRYRLQKQISELGEAHEAELAQELSKRENELAQTKREQAAAEVSAETNRSRMNQELVVANEALEDARAETQEFRVAIEELKEQAGASEHELRLAERSQERDEAASTAAVSRSELQIERERVASLHSDIEAPRSAVMEQLDRRRRHMTEKSSS